MDRLDGVGCLEFDKDSATQEDAKLREQVGQLIQKLGRLGWIFFSASPHSGRSNI